VPTPNVERESEREPEMGLYKALATLLLVQQLSLEKTRAHPA